MSCLNDHDGHFNGVVVQTFASELNDAECAAVTPDGRLLVLFADDKMLWHYIGGTAQATAADGDSEVDSEGEPSLPGDDEVADNVLMSFTDKMRVLEDPSEAVLDAKFLPDLSLVLLCMAREGLRSVVRRVDGQGGTLWRTELPEGYQGELDVTPEGSAVVLSLFRDGSGELALARLCAQSGVFLSFAPVPGLLSMGAICAARDGVVYIGDWKADVLCKVVAPDAPPVVMALGLGFGALSLGPSGALFVCDSTSKGDMFIAELRGEQDEVHRWKITEGNGLSAPASALWRVAVADDGSRVVAFLSCGKSVVVFS